MALIPDIISTSSNEHKLQNQINSEKKINSELHIYLLEAQNAKAELDSQLQQKNSSEAKLKAQLEDLNTRLQSKINNQQRIASISSGRGGLNSSGGFINSYAWGNCTWFVASLVQVPDDWHDAENWDSAARADGYVVSDIPRINSIAQSDAGYYGHVGLVIDIQAGEVLLKEMNVYGLGVIDERWVPTSDYEYIYI